MVKRGPKQKTARFQKGHSINSHRSSVGEKIDRTECKKYVRLDRKRYDSYVRCQMGPDNTELVNLVDVNLQPCLMTGILRPGPRLNTTLDTYLTADVKEPELDTYRLLHLGKTADLWNTAFKEHSNLSPGCSGEITWDLQNEIKWGMCQKESLICKSCKYRSKTKKLYDEVNTGNRGQKPGAPNYRLQVGLSHTSIGNSEFSHLLNTLNMPSPALSGMQKNSNTVCNELVTQNNQTMLEIENSIKAMNVIKGLPEREASSINLEMDCRYNNPQYSGVGNTPFQAATQVSLTSVENCSKEKKVIDLVVKNKLCQTARRLERKSGESVSCPNHKGICSANLQVHSVIGDEGSWAKESLLKMASNKTEVKHLTTDADSSLYCSARDLYETGITSVEPQHQLDTRHIGKSQRGKVKNMIFDMKTFSGKTASERRTQQARFADDIASRCHAEHSAAYRQLGGHSPKLERNITFAKDAILLCYQGDHSLCKLYSYVCRGDKGDNWIRNSSFLPIDFKMTCSSETEYKIRECVDFRLGQDTLKKTAHLLNTQKCEAVNRVISKSVPKNKTFSRNVQGRTHSAINAVNFGLAESVIKQCEYVASPITKGSKAAHTLVKKQHLEYAKRIIKSGSKSKAARIAKRKKLYRIHLKMNEAGSTFYKKDMIKPIKQKEDRPAFLKHHSYYSLRNKRVAEYGECSKE